MTDRPAYVSTLFQPDRHEISGFTCGVPELDVWLEEHAASAARARIAQTFVWVEGDDLRVVGYYTLSAHAVPRGEAPSRIGRGVPDPVPAALLGKLALDLSLRGQGLGDILLADALARLIDASELGPAIRAIVVDAATDDGRALYARFGFVPVAGREDRMIIRAETVAKAIQRTV